MDFANTVYPPEAGGSLRSWEDLVEFLLASGIIHQRHRQQLLHLAVAAPEAVTAALRAGLALRDALRSIVEAMATRREIEPAWIESINAILRWTEGYDRLVPAEPAAWRLEFAVREDRLEWLLAAISRSAAELVAEGRHAPVRKCARPGCVLYFYDTSRTGRRRWCSMAVCGNRSKVAAHARRRRERAARRSTGRD